jgi:DNA-binding protein HU-beta
LSNEEKVVTKQKLIETLASETKMSKRQVETVLMSMVDVVGRTIKKGEKVSITGFGTFDLGKRARRGVNPQTGEEIRIPEMPMPRFRAGKRLKEEVR